MCGDSRPRLSSGAKLRSIGELTLARTVEGGCAHVILGRVEKSEAGSSAPGHLLLMIFKIVLASRGPTGCHLQGSAHAFAVRRILRTLIECHDDVGAQPDLHLH